MKPRRQALILFCEDVRFELGDKVSYLGIIGPDVWVRTNEEIDFRCVFLAWAFEPEVSIEASYQFVGAPADTRAPAPIVRRLRKNESDEADRWLIQMTGKIRVRVDETPVTVRARFALGKEVYTNRIIFDPIPAERFAETVQR